VQVDRRPPPGGWLIDTGQRKNPANAIPSAPRADTTGQWKHDLFKTVNKSTIATNDGTQAKEQPLQFPPKRYTEAEKSQVCTESS
jgi:hypothetical protein